MDILNDDGSTLEQIPAKSDERFFQLTHDYLVQPLRQWLTRKQQETRKGRAELRLVEYSEFWNAKPEKRRLPSWWEFLNMRLFTRKRNWTAPQAAMMRRAATMFGVRAIILLAIAGLLGFIGYDLNGRIKADNIVRTLISAETQDVPMLVEDLQPYRRWADPLLRQAVATRGPQEQLHARLALSVDDPLQAEFLTAALLRAKPEDVPVILRFLRRPKKELVQRLWERLDAPKQPAQRLRAASALAAFSPQDEKWKQAGAEVAAELVNVPPITAMIWIRNLRPAHASLLETLKVIFRKRSIDNAERAIAAAALGDYLNDQPDELIKLILLADSDDQYAPLRAELVRYPSQAVSGLTEALIAPVPQVEEEERNWHLKRQANAAVCLIDLGKGDSVWQVLKHSANPSLRSYMIQRFGLLGAGLLPMIDRLNSETNASVKTAIILALGEFKDIAVPLDRRTRLIDKLVRMYRRDPHPAIHSAVCWTATRWGREAAIKGSDTELLETGPQFDKRFAKDPRRWTVNSQRQSFTVVPGPVVLVRPKHRFKGTLQQERIPYGFAVSVHEVTVKQFLAFRPKHRYETEYSPRVSCPINNATWYDAAAYCNWLNGKEGIPQEQWSYQPNAKGNYADGMTIAADWHKRRGYRLATEVELEYINRAGSQTRFGFGHPLELLEHYDWYVLNSQFRMWPVGMKKPNDLGMFDTHGNAWEWCHNRRNTTAGIRRGKEVIKDDLPRRARNGVFFYLATSVASHERKAFSPKQRSNNLSFRLVRRVGR